jgi:hypothetical protein
MQISIFTEVLCGTVVADEGTLGTWLLRGRQMDHDAVLCACYPERFMNRV